MPEPVRSEFDRLLESAEARITQLTARLSALELALASHAAPAISQVEHDGHALLLKWFAEFKSIFRKAVEPAASPGEPPPNSTAATAASQARSLGPQ